jgi:hypothetical protein
LWLCWSTYGDGIENFEGTDATIQFIVGETRFQIKGSILSVSKHTPILKIVVFSNFITGKEFISLLKKEHTVEVSIIAPKELVAKLDITADTFSLNGFVATMLKAEEYCKEQYQVGKPTESTTKLNKSERTINVSEGVKELFIFLIFLIFLMMLFAVRKGFIQSGNKVDNGKEESRDLTAKTDNDFNRTIDKIKEDGSEKTLKVPSSEETLPKNIRDLYFFEESDEENHETNLSSIKDNNSIKVQAQDTQKATKPDKDPEFDKKNLILQRFLMIQELPLGEGKPQALFTDEQEKARYIHFVFGAIDLLSRTIKDEKRSELWAMTTSMGRAAILFGIDEALNHVESFGRTDNKSLEAASKSGWDAMRIFLLGLNDKASKEDTLKNALSLFKAVREQ